MTSCEKVWFASMHGQDILVSFAMDQCYCFSVQVHLTGSHLLSRISITVLHSICFCGFSAGQNSLGASGDFQLFYTYIGTSSRNI